MKFRDIQLHEDDFDVFVTLNPSQKLEFIDEIKRNGTVDSYRYASEADNDENVSVFQYQEVAYGDDFMNIMQYDNILRLNSTSLKMIRKFVHKLWMDGLIMNHIDIKKSKLDVHRYLRVYRLVEQYNPICEN